MHPKPLALAAGLLVASVALAGPAGAHPAATALAGTVGPGFTITLTKGGANVTSLKPGTYQCDPHAARGMKGTFRVSATAPATTAQTTTTATTTTPPSTTMTTGSGAGGYGY
jgi:hypothetical protein